MLKYGGDYRVLTSHRETLLHLASRGIWSRLQEIKEELTDELCR